MPANDPSKLRFLLPGVAISTTASRAHGPASRGAGAQADALLANLEVVAHFDLSAPSRATGQEASLEAFEDDILALDMEEGFIFYTSAGRLADDLRWLDPEAEQDGALRLDTLRQRGPATRGLRDWVVRAVSVLRLGKDQIIDAAVEKAKEWVGGRAADLVEKGASWAGTKALMWAIEQKLDREPGLYPWVGADGGLSDLQATQPADFKDWGSEQPILVFIHGTASSTLGSFDAFREPTSRPRVAGAARQIRRTYLRLRASHLLRKPHRERARARQGAAGWRAPQRGDPFARRPGRRPAVPGRTGRENESPASAAKTTRCKKPTSRTASICWNWTACWRRRISASNATCAWPARRAAPCSPAATPTPSCPCCCT
jgi:hypothetical protein